MQKVLLVEDSQIFQEIVASALEGLGVGLSSVGTAGEAWISLEREKFDLILLDVLLPDESGFDFCKRLQADLRFREIPIFFLTGKAEMSDKVTGFSVGADDYIVKPFDLSELRVRVMAKLGKLMRKAAVATDSLLLGNLKIDVAGQRVYLNEGHSRKGIALTPAEFRILYFLGRHQGEVISGRRLMAAVWGEDLHVVEQNLYTHMHSLRKKLGNQSSLIESIRGGGYRLAI